MFREWKNYLKKKLLEAVKNTPINDVLKNMSYDSVGKEYR